MLLQGIHRDLLSSMDSDRPNIRVINVSVSNYCKCLNMKESVHCITQLVMTVINMSVVLLAQHAYILEINQIAAQYIMIIMQKKIRNKHRNRGGGILE